MTASSGREARAIETGSAPPEDLRRRAVQRVVTILREQYDPVRIILFGSWARGDPGPDSDIDLLIVKETSQRPVDRMREVYRLVYSPNEYLALDPVVYTPSELAHRLALRDPFVHDILREGQVVYERP